MGQTTRRLGFVGIALALIVTETEAAVINFACGGRDTLTKVVRFLSPGDVLLVSGNCVENVFIGSTVGDVTLDGQNVATVSGATTTSASFIVRGRNITIRNFTITGGSDGVFFTDGGSGVVNHNTIEGNSGYGVQVTRTSAARIVNNTIQTNAAGGIFVTLSSAADIGVFGGSDAVASPNTIQNNAGEGIQVTRSSSARVVGNTIAGNGLDGVLVIRGSQADMASNTIDGNGGNGIQAAQNSTINLGRNSGTGIFDLPNSTTAGNPNAVWGVICTDGFVTGRLGTLDGSSTANVGGCQGVLNP